jgi:hypothetical protein
VCGDLVDSYGRWKGLRLQTTPNATRGCHNNFEYQIPCRDMLHSAMAGWVCAELSARSLCPPPHPLTPLACLLLVPASTHRLGFGARVTEVARRECGVDVGVAGTGASRVHGAGPRSTVLCTHPCRRCIRLAGAFFYTPVGELSNQNRAHTAPRNVSDVSEVTLLTARSPSSGTLRQVCNPPFFGSVEEQRKFAKVVADEQADASSDDTVPNAHEAVCCGGEAQFLTTLLTDSLALGAARVRWYASLVGKKATLKTMVERMHAAGVHNIRTTRFFQGYTVRWVTNPQQGVCLRSSASRYGFPQALPSLPCSFAHPLSPVACVSLSLISLCVWTLDPCVSLSLISLCVWTLDPCADLCHGGFLRCGGGWRGPSPQTAATCAAALPRRRWWG